MLGPILVLVAILLLAGLIVVIVTWWSTILVHAAQESGTSNEASRSYAFWSGFGSDLGELTLITAILTPVVVAARHHNCATKGCWRLTSHELEDPDTHVKYRLCHKHHPAIPDEHSHHGLFHNHMTDTHLADLKDRAASTDSSG